jgi:hypothetical protein
MHSTFSSLVEQCSQTKCARATRLEVRRYYVALHAMYGTVHRALINGYSHAVYTHNHCTYYTVCRSIRGLDLVLTFGVWGGSLLLFPGYNTPRLKQRLMWKFHESIAAVPL